MSADLAGSRLLVLGAGRHQAGLIARAEARGVAVVAADYYPDAPGKAVASFPQDVDALDLETNLALAARYRVDGVTTTGTDMAVVTMANVAAAASLPCYLTPRTARYATDKVEMAAAFERHGVPRAPLTTVTDAEVATEKAAELQAPFVVKPADSQGQRGTTFVEQRTDLGEAVATALANSRRGLAIVEEFLPGSEVAVSAWVHNGVASVLTVTDRITYNPPPALGIAVQHVFPSRSTRGMLPEIERHVQRIAEAYEMTHGPLYMQMLAAPRGLVVVEAAARVGGGHEPSLIPLVTGIDVTDRVIDLALTGTCEPPRRCFTDTDNQRHGVVCFLVARPGRVASMRGFGELHRNGVIVEGGFYLKPGDETMPIVNSLGRVGYFVTTAATREDLNSSVRAAFDRLELIDEHGENLLFWPEEQWINR